MHPLEEAILLDPKDNTLRLAYADYLEETGNPERSEFIRLQIRVWEIIKSNLQFRCAKPDCPCKSNFLYRSAVPECEDYEWNYAQQRLRELQTAHGHDWVPRIPGITHDGANIYGRAILTVPDSEGVSFVVEALYERGFIERIKCPIRFWIGKPCWRCNGRKQDCAMCFGKGRLLGFGPELMKLAPIDDIFLEDVHPHENWDWRIRQRDGFSWYSHDLTEPIYNRLKDGKDAGNGTYRLLSLGEAYRSASRALIEWAKEQTENESGLQKISL